MLLRILIGATAAIALTSSAVVAQAWAPNRDSVAAILQDRIARKQSVGMIVGWSRNGVAQFVAAGTRGGASSAAPDSATVFEIGSVSKVLTTTLLAIMVERGEVVLDEPVARLLPPTVKVPARNGKQIRLVDLATASSGLPRVPDVEPVDPANPYAAFGPEQLYQYLNDYTLTRDPGAQYEYSNLGMGLLGHALALRSGKTYEDAVRELVLAPAGLRATRIQLTDDQRRRLAPGHDVNLEPVSNWDFYVLAGAGGWRSTAADMVRLLQAVVPAPAGPLGPATKLAIEPRMPTGAPGLSIGLGWHTFERGNRRVVWHSGETGGYHTFFAFVPETGANVVVLSNAALDIDDVGLHVLDPAFPLRPLPAAPKTVAVTEAALGRYVGTYRLAPTFDIAITRSGDRLFAQATGQPRYRIYPVALTRFALTVVEAEIEFVVEGSGPASRLILRQNGRDTTGERVR